MEFVRKHADNFAELFRGNPNAYGVHIPEKKNIKEGEKAVGKTFTKTKAVTIDNYIRHLHGEESLAIIPINQEGNVFFMVIDVDVYPLNPLVYLRILAKANLPLVMFKSKSGGLHIYLFFSEAASAKEAMSHILTIRQVLGLPRSTEIFPKQVRLVGGAVGSHVNIPYFNFSNTARYAYDTKGEQLDLEQAVDTAFNSRVTLKELSEFVSSLPLAQAPPCLQSIYMCGAEGLDERNTFLFNCGIYLKARFKEDFGEYLHRLNRQLLDPVEYTELDTTVIASHNKQEYTYQCSSGILSQLCDREMCKKRKYGIKSKNISNLTFEDLVQIKSSDPYYIWTVNGERLTFFNEKELLNQNRFKELCLRQLYLVPRRLTDSAWSATLTRALENIKIEVPDDSDDLSTDSLWLLKVGEFLSRGQARTPDQVEDGLVYYKADKKQLHFKGARLLQFLTESTGFRDYAVSKHRTLLKKLGAKQTRLTIGKRKVIRTWCVNIDQLQEKGYFLEVPVNAVNEEEFEEIKFTGEEKF